MLSLIHRKDGKALKVDVCGGISILADVVASSSGLTVCYLTILKKNLAIKPTFFCIGCYKEVPPEEVGIRCMNCGETKSIQEIKIPNQSGGAYCSKCFSKRFSDEKGIPLEETFNKVIIR